jgi:protease I
MAKKLSDKKIAFLVANEGAEQVELVEPRKAVEEAGAETDLARPAGWRREPGPAAHE